MIMEGLHVSHSVHVETFMLAGVLTSLFSEALVSKAQPIGFVLIPTLKGCHCNVVQALPP